MSQSRLFTCLKGIAILVFLIFFQAASAQKTVKEFGIAAHPELDAFVKLKEKQLGSHAVVMVWGDTLLYKKEVGMFSARTPIPIGSASQWLTAAMVMIMVQEGKISLEDKVSSFIPEFQKYGKNYITIRHCLSHFTGIETETKGLFGSKGYSTLESEVNGIAAKEIRTNPGTEFRYSEFGMNIAARILEIVTKKKFDMLIQQKLFRPLGMRNTTFSNVTGGAIDPSHGAKSTAEDYMKFLTMMLRGGTFGKVQLLKPESVEELRKIHAAPQMVKAATKTAEGFSYALGAWSIEGEEKADVLVSPGTGGTWTLIDYKKGYAFLVFPKSTTEQKKELYLQMKDAIDTDRQ